MLMKLLLLLITISVTIGKTNTFVPPNKCAICKQVAKNWWEGFAYAKQQDLDLDGEEITNIVEQMGHAGFTLAAYRDAPGRGWCQDKNGEESRNRSYRNANCEENCSDDPTCSGYAYDPVSKNCVWYTDYNPMQKGLANSVDFAIFQAGSDGSKEWANAVCHVKVDNSKNPVTDMTEICDEVRRSFGDEDSRIYDLVRKFQFRGDFKYSMCGELYCEAEIGDLN
eukprot:UN30198